MEGELKVTVVQTELIWENVSGNLLMLNQKLSAVWDTDLIVLPEMFSTGFSMNTALAEKMDGSTVKWMEQTAREKNCVITGSLIIQENNTFYNRLIWMTPEGKVQHYDKRHLFSLSDEPVIFTKGEEKLITTIKGWKILPLICYDLRFPVWSRNIDNYDVLIYVANWPERRSDAWKTLLKARAIENQCYVIGVNRVGDDGNGVYHSGDSAVINAEGNCLYEKAHIEEVITLVLSQQKLIEFRSKFSFLNDRDLFTMHI